MQQVMLCVNIGGPPSKSKKFWWLIVNKYCEGKVKKSLNIKHFLKFNADNQLKLNKSNSVPFA